MDDKNAYNEQLEEVLTALKTAFPAARLRIQEVEVALLNALGVAGVEGVQVVIPSAVLAGETLRATVLTNLALARNVTFAATETLRGVNVYVNRGGVARVKDMLRRIWARMAQIAPAAAGPPVVLEIRGELESDMEPVDILALVPGFAPTTGGVAVAMAGNGAAELKMREPVVTQGILETLGITPVNGANLAAAARTVTVRARIVQFIE
jgi:hypothetical protein